MYPHHLTIAAHLELVLRRGLDDFRGVMEQRQFSVSVPSAAIAKGGRELVREECCNRRAVLRQICLVPPPLDADERRRRRRVRETGGMRVAVRGRVTDFANKRLAAASAAVLRFQGALELHHALRPS